VILGDGAVELLNVLFPHLAGIHVERVVASDRSVQLEAAVRGPGGTCPVCGRTSSRVHSRYVRCLADRGVAGRGVAIRLRVRRLFCGNPECPRRIFAEQVDGLTEPYRRCSPALKTVFVDLGLALGGRAGARMTRRLDAERSRTTLLRLVRDLPEPAPGPLRAVGVDEFALRRGHTYGTVLVDMVTHRPIDLLQDRTADTLAAWLKDHPGIEVICRDRAGPYAEGARRGAPGALQVADRWHLLRNLADVLEQVVKRNRAALVELPPDPAGDSEVAVTPVDGPLATRTRQRHAEVHQLVARGIGHTAICERLGLDLKTLHRYVRAASPEDLLAPRPTSPDPHKAYLARRYAEGCTDGARLWAEVLELGYGGCRRRVRRYLNTLDGGPARSARSSEATARQVCQWVLRRQDRLGDDDRAHLNAICERCPTLATVTRLVQGFARLLRERRGPDHLIAWIEAAESADILELQAFASGLRKDWAAVSAGVTLAWSSGAVEGHVNRIKMLKRQMYGRANLDLLRVRTQPDHRLQGAGSPEPRRHGPRAARPHGDGLEFCGRGIAFHSDARIRTSR
jgi:transposase